MKNSQLSKLLIATMCAYILAPSMSFGDENDDNDQIYLSQCNVSGSRWNNKFRRLSGPDFSFKVNGDKITMDGSANYEFAGREIEKRESAIRSGRDNETNDELRNRPSYYEFHKHPSLAYMDVSGAGDTIIVTFHSTEEIGKKIFEIGDGRSPEANQALKDFAAYIEKIAEKYQLAPDVVENMRRTLHLHQLADPYEEIKAYLNKDPSTLTSEALVDVINDLLGRFDDNEYKAKFLNSTAHLLLKKTANTGPAVEDIYLLALKLAPKNSQIRAEILSNLAIYHHGSNSAFLYNPNDSEEVKKQKNKARVKKVLEYGCRVGKNADPKVLELNQDLLQLVGKLVRNDYAEKHVEIAPLPFKIQKGDPEQTLKMLEAYGELERTKRTEKTQLGNPQNHDTLKKSDYPL